MMQINSVMNFKRSFARLRGYMSNFYEYVGHSTASQPDKSVKIAETANRIQKLYQSFDNSFGDLDNIDLEMVKARTELAGEIFDELENLCSIVNQGISTKTDPI